MERCMSMFYCVVLNGVATGLAGANFALKESYQMSKRMIDKLEIQMVLNCLLPNPNLHIIHNCVL
jgi:hypothetical protein